MIEEINTKAKRSLSHYEVVDDIGRICYVDGFESGYNEALADIFSGAILDSYILKIQYLVVKWNYGGIDKSPYKDLTEYVKEKLKK